MADTAMFANPHPVQSIPDPNQKLARNSRLEGELKGKDCLTLTR
jgi:hypothetical protein